MNKTRIEEAFKDVKVAHTWNFLGFDETIDTYDDEEQVTAIHLLYAVKVGFFIKISYLEQSERFLLTEIKIENGKPVYKNKCNVRTAYELKKHIQDNYLQ